MSDANESSLPSKPIPGLPDDWHLKATEQIVGKVDMVREKTSGPAIGVARMAVFGTMAAILGTMAGIVLVIGLVRMLDAILPPSVWLTYLILGTIFVLIGLFVWSKRPRGVS